MKTRIPKLILKKSELDSSSIWDKDFAVCYDCNSNIMYVEIEKGIVKETDDWGIVGNQNNTTWQLRDIRLSLYCAECGCFNEFYFKMYSDKEVIYSFDKEMDEDEIAEIQYCLSQFNQKRDFKPQYKFSELGAIKKALLESCKGEKKGGKNGKNI